MKRKNILKTQENILPDLENMNNSKVNYSDIPPMTEEERKTAQFYYKDFLDKLPPETVKDLVQRRLSEVHIPETV
jgi:hypothetical protein